MELARQSRKGVDVLCPNRLETGHFALHHRGVLGAARIAEMGVQAHLPANLVIGRLDLTRNVLRSLNLSEQIAETTLQQAV